MEVMVSGYRPDYYCLIVGAGFSGIGTAIKLDQDGFDDYLIVEAGDGVGGTWHWHRRGHSVVFLPVLV
jgi:cation diffusion facilitator CzcD-associated flavoprotein CzcO